MLLRFSRKRTVCELYSWWGFLSGYQDFIQKIDRESDVCMYFRIENRVLMALCVFVGLEYLRTTSADLL
jgi:hypothetical protein